MAKRKQATREWDFRMCKYCGSRIETPFNKWGKRNENGVYCSEACSDAVHGFDNRMQSSRRNGVCSLDLSRHDAPCSQTPEPWERMAEEEENAELAEAKAEIDRRRKVDEVMRVARGIDSRLPGILQAIADGETQTSIAKRLGVKQYWITRCIKRIGARLSAPA